MTMLRNSSILTCGINKYGVIKRMMKEKTLLFENKRLKKAMRRICLGLLAVMLLAALAGCGKNPLNPKSPVTITLWHTYGQQMEITIGSLIEEFNHTVGKDRGIIVEIGYVADAAEMNELLHSAANREPGAKALPDMAVIYPRIGVTLAEKGLLLNLSEQFSESELSLYVPNFLEEGKLTGGNLYILPIAKSTEILYLNKTIFDRFAADTGVTLAQLATMEGIAEAGEKYHQWSGGKAFFYPVELFNTALIGMRQLGEDFVRDYSLNLSSPAFKKIWDAYYPAAVKGETAIYDYYGNLLMATGDVICVSGTTAGVTFYTNQVMYPDNTKESIELTFLPYPVFTGGEKVVLQRGGGICIFRSDQQREYAAGVFLKWLTEPEQNLRFTAQNGYIPVIESLYEDFLSDGLENITNDNIRQVYETVREMKREYSFYYPPAFDGIDDMKIFYNRSLRSAAAKSRGDYLSLIEAQGADAAYENVSRGVFEQFIAPR